MTFPPNLQWIDAQGVASMIGGSTTARHVRERVACLPDFPIPVRVPTETGALGRPRWRTDEVAHWLERLRARQICRRRRDAN